MNRSARELSKVVSVIAGLHILKLAHLEEVALSINLLHRFVKRLQTHMVMRHSRRSSVSTGIAKAERLGRLAQIFILVADVLLGIDTIIV